MTPVSPPSPSGLGTSWPFSPPIFFSHPKPFLISLHFSSLFSFRLGSLLGSIFGPFGCPSWPKFGNKSLLDILFLQKRIFSRNAASPKRTPILRPQDGSQNDPRWLQDRFKTVLKSVFLYLRFCIRFWCVLDAFLVPFSAPKIPKSRASARLVEL